MRKIAVQSPNESQDALTVAAVAAADCLAGLIDVMQTSYTLARWTNTSRVRRYDGPARHSLTARSAIR